MVAPWVKRKRKAQAEAITQAKISSDTKKRAAAQAALKVKEAKAIAEAATLEAAALGAANAAAEIVKEAAPKSKRKYTRRRATSED